MTDGRWRNFLYIFWGFIIFQQVYEADNEVFMIFTTKERTNEENLTQIEIKTYKLINANKQEACSYIVQGPRPAPINGGRRTHW